MLGLNTDGRAINTCRRGFGCYCRPVRFDRGWGCLKVWPCPLVTCLLALFPPWSPFSCSPLCLSSLPSLLLSTSLSSFPFFASSLLFSSPLSTPLRASPLYSFPVLACPFFSSPRLSSPLLFSPLLSSTLLYSSLLFSTLLSSPLLSSSATRLPFPFLSSSTTRFTPPIGSSPNSLLSHHCTSLAPQGLSRPLCRPLPYWRQAPELRCFPPPLPPLTRQPF